MTYRIIKYFFFKINQFFRLFNYESDFGAINSIGFLSIILVNINKFPFLFVLPILLIHFQRKDLFFLKKTFSHFSKILILIEYSFLYVLFIISNIHYSITINSIYIHTIILSIIFIPPLENKSFFLIKWHFIPNILFEWKSFLRKKTLIFFLYWVGLLFSAYHPFTLILMGIFYLDFISNIYKYNESKELLQSFFKQYHFSEKLKFNLLFFNLTLLPTFIIYIAKNYLRIEYLIYYLAFMNLYLLLTITRKYKIYHHNRLENSYHSGIFTKYLISSIFIIPFFFFFKENYHNATKKINLY